MSMNTSEFKCEFCSKILKNKSNLNQHIKTAKYCLKLRNIEPPNEVKCDYCSFKTTIPFTLKRHIELCKPKFEGIKKQIHQQEQDIFLLKQKNKELKSLKNQYQQQCINLQFELDQNNEKCTLRILELREDYEAQIDTLKEEYEKRIDKLKEEYKSDVRELNQTIKDMAVRAIEKPTNITNTNTTNNTNNTNNINNLVQAMEPITPEYLKECSQNFTIEHILKGAEGYAEYYLNHPLKDRLICSDYSRRKVKYKDPQGNIITDPELQKLTPLLFESIKEVHDQLSTQHMDSASIQEWKKRHYDRYMDLFGQIMKQKKSIMNASNGEESKFARDVIKKICSGTIIVENEENEPLL